MLFEVYYNEWLCEQVTLLSVDIVFVTNKITVVIVILAAKRSSSFSTLLKLLLIGSWCSQIDLLHRFIRICRWNP